MNATIYDLLGRNTNTVLYVIGRDPDEISETPNGDKLFRYPEGDATSLAVNSKGTIVKCSGAA